MFYHKSCGNLLRIDITPHSRILADFTVIGKFTAQVTNLSFTRKSKGRIPIKYYCKKCRVILGEKEEIIVPCNKCGETFDISMMKTPTESGGVFCEKCIKGFKDEKISTISIRDIKFQ